MIFLLAVILLASILWYVYHRVTSKFHYWRGRGIPYLEGSFPFGTKPNGLSNRVHDGYNVQEVYNKLAPHPYGGIHSILGPQLFLRDPAVIQQILVKDFSHFRNRLQMKNESKGMLNQHLFLLEGDFWRALRVKLSPTFTSGKMKGMFSIFKQCSDKLSERLEKEVGLESIEPVDVKDLISRFTLDIIVSCAFGLESNAIGNEESTFREIGPYIFPKKISILMLMSRLLEVFYPSLAPILPSFLPKRLEKFMFDSIASSIEYREKNGIKRNDFLNLLIELKNQGRVHVDHKETEEDEFLIVDSEETDEIEIDLPLIVAQCFVFFAAGFETSSSVQSFALYELAVHQNMQDRLREEIKGILEACNGQVTYQAVHEMKYLDQVVKEALRKYPTVPVITRLCVKDYKLPNSDLIIEKGTGIVIPIYALHHDGRLFPEPDSFDPERFSDENASNVKPFTFLPFGEGPRMCIGMRFGMLQTKLGLFTILANYRVALDGRTPIPLHLSEAPVTAPKHPILLQFYRVT